MTELVWSPQSIDDLQTIRAYIAVDSPLYADLTVRRIVAAVERLKTFPESGRIVPERNAPDIREVIVGRYRVIYRRKVGAIEIATVFRGSRESSRCERVGAAPLLTGAAPAEAPPRDDDDDGSDSRPIFGPGGTMGGM